MASTYSALKIELIATGEQSGTWGTTTNTNLGDAALGEAITGSADVAFSSADVTVTLTDTNASQTARNLRLNLTGTSGGARQLILGSGCQIEKLYLINNGLADAVTVKNTGGTGIAVPAGKSMFVYNNGTNVVDAVTHLSSLTLGSALAVTSGGTGQSSALVAGGVLYGASTSAAGVTSVGTSGQPLLSGGASAPSFGTLSVAAGGTGQTSYTDGQLLIGNTTGNTLAKATLTGTANQVVVTNGNGTITLSTPQSIGTASSVQFGSFGVGTAASGTTGEIRATNNVTAYYSSDIRLKSNIQDIPNALDKVLHIGGKTFDWSDNYIAEHGGEDGYFVQKSDFGVIAQDVQEVFPQAVRTRDDGTLAVDYAKLSALAFAAIAELKARIEQLASK
jgi:hypothetical protein